MQEDGSHFPFADGKAVMETGKRGTAPAASHVLSTKEFENIYLGQPSRGVTATTYTRRSPARGGSHPRPPRSGPSPRAANSKDARLARAYGVKAGPIPGTTPTAKENESMNLLDAYLDALVVAAKPRDMGEEAANGLQQQPSPSASPPVGVPPPSRQAHGPSFPPQRTPTAPVRPEGKISRRLRSQVRAHRGSRSRGRTPMAGVTGPTTGSNRSEYHWLSMERELHDTKARVVFLEKALQRAQVTIRSLYGAGYDGDASDAAGPSSHPEVGRLVSSPADTPEVSKEEEEAPAPEKKNRKSRERANTSIERPQSSQTVVGDRQRLAKRVCFLEERLTTMEAELLAAQQDTRATRTHQLKAELRAAEEFIAQVRRPAPSTAMSQAVAQETTPSSARHVQHGTDAAPTGTPAQQEAPTPDNNGKSAVAPTELEEVRRVTKLKEKLHKLKDLYGVAQSDLFTANAAAAELSMERAALVRELETYRRMPQELVRLSEELETTRAGYMECHRTLQRYQQVYDKFPSPATVERMLAEHDHLVGLVRQKNEQEVALRDEMERSRKAAAKEAEERLGSALEQERAMAADRERELLGTVAQLKRELAEAVVKGKRQWEELTARLAEMKEDHERAFTQQLLTASPQRASAPLAASPVIPIETAAVRGPSDSPTQASSATPMEKEGIQTDLQTPPALSVADASSSETITSSSSSSSAPSSHSSSSSSHSEADSSASSAVDSVSLSNASNAEEEVLTPRKTAETSALHPLPPPPPPAVVPAAPTPAASAASFTKAAASLSEEVIPVEVEGNTVAEDDYGLLEDDVDLTPVPMSTSTMLASPPTSVAIPPPPVVPVPAPPASPSAPKSPARSPVRKGFTFPAPPRALPPPISILVSRLSNASPHFAHARVTVHSPTPSLSADAANALSATQTATAEPTSATGTSELSQSSGTGTAGSGTDSSSGTTSSTTHSTPTTTSLTEESVDKRQNEAPPTALVTNDAPPPVLPVAPPVTLGSPEGPPVAGSATVMSASAAPPPAFPPPPAVVPPTFSPRPLAATTQENHPGEAADATAAGADVSVSPADASSVSISRNVSTRAIPSPPTTFPVRSDGVSPIPASRLLPVFTNEEEYMQGQSGAGDWSMPYQYSGNASFDFVGGLAERRKLEELRAQAEANEAINSSSGSQMNLGSPLEEGSPAAGRLASAVAEAASGRLLSRPGSASLLLDHAARTSPERQGAARYGSPMDSNPSSLQPSAPANQPLSVGAADALQKDSLSRTPSAPEVAVVVPNPTPLDAVAAANHNATTAADETPRGSADGSNEGDADVAAPALAETLPRPATPHVAGSASDTSNGGAHSHVASVEDQQTSAPVPAGEASVAPPESGEVPTPAVPPSLPDAAPTAQPTAPIPRNTEVGEETHSAVSVSSSTITDIGDVSPIRGPSLAEAVAASNENTLDTTTQEHGIRPSVSYVGDGEAASAHDVHGALADRAGEDADLTAGADFPAVGDGDSLRDGADGGASAPPEMGDSPEVSPERAHRFDTTGGESSNTSDNSGESFVVHHPSS